MKLFLMLILSTSLYAQPKMWRVYKIYNTGIRYDEETTGSHPKSYYNPNYFDLKALCNMAWNTADTNGLTKIAIHPDITNAVMVWSPVDVSNSGIEYGWIWFIWHKDKFSSDHQILPSGWEDVFHECNKEGDPDYDSVILSKGINPKWKVEDHPVSYNYPWHKKRKVIKIKKFVGWGMNNHKKSEFTTDVSWMNFLTDISNEKDINGVEITCDSVYYLQKYYQDVTKTIEVP